MRQIMRRVSVTLAIMLAVAWVLAVVGAAYLWPQVACWGKEVTCPVGMFGVCGIVVVGIIVFVAASWMFRRLLSRLDAPRPSGSADQ